MTRTTSRFVCQKNVVDGKSFVSPSRGSQRSVRQVRSSKFKATCEAFDHEGIIGKVADLCLRSPLKWKIL